MTGQCAGKPADLVDQGPCKGANLSEGSGVVPTVAALPFQEDPLTAIGIKQIR